MTTFFLLVGGAILGAVLDEDAGWAFGAAIGVLLGLILAERRKRVALENLLSQEVAKVHLALNAYRDQMAEALGSVATSETVSPSEAPNDLGAPPAESDVATEGASDPHVPAASDPTSEAANDEAEPSPDAAPEVPREDTAVAAFTATKVAPAPAPPPPASPTPFASPPPDPFDVAAKWLKELVFGGNTVVRAGTLVLLVGVTLLLKYAAEHSLFPIELRMAGAATIGLGLVLGGLRLRSVKAGFGETLQGGGIATMYLVVFFSFRVYELLPAPLAFGLLAAIACLSAVLAVVQNALALVVIGQVGGFLAPVLASTGSGNHVALFSYYLVLNLAITGVAWFRAWRVLNLIGFAFTFGIGATWGVLSYSPEDFSSTEPFLVAFFLLYVALPVLFALRGPAKGWVDGTLVFGVPLAFLGLQLALVRAIPFAMAYTTVGLMALYLGLARTLRHGKFEHFALMRLSFLALAIGFGTLAIPYAFDSSGLSAAAWAVEGAGLYFLGVRQKRVISRVAAVVLQLLAGVTILMYLSAAPPPGALPFLHGRFLAALFATLSSFFIAATAHRSRRELGETEALGLQFGILWGLFLLLPNLDHELRRVVALHWLPGVRVFCLGLLGMVLERVGRRLEWSWVRFVPVALVFLLIPLTLVWHESLPGHLLAHGGFIGWPFYFVSVGFTLRGFAPVMREALGSLHPVSLWGATLFGSLLLSEVCGRTLGLGEPWSAAAFGLGLTGMLFVLSRRSVASFWPVAAEPALYLGVGQSALGVAVLLWVLATSIGRSGSDVSLGYVPLLNPLELVAVGALLSALDWHRTSDPRAATGAGIRRRLPLVVALLSFVLWNALMARSAHRYFDVDWDPDRLWAFGPLQVAISISWTSIGLFVTVLASRRKHRALWIGGATLLFVVVFKLFIVDLANLPTIAKIGTFLVVGLLLLLVGYFSPVPPARPEPNAEPQKPESEPEQQVSAGGVE